MKRAMKTRNITDADNGFTKDDVDNVIWSSPNEQYLERDADEAESVESMAERAGYNIGTIRNKVDRRKQQRSTYLLPLPQSYQVHTVHNPSKSHK